MTSPPMARATGLVIVWYAAIVAANLTTAAWGADWSIVNAFLLVGLVLTTRDALDDLWQEHRLRNMALLIASGSALSYVAALTITPDTVPSDVVAKIALASCAAFAVAESVDWAIYSVLRARGWEWMDRANASNIGGAVLDSLVFVWIAFGLSSLWPVAFNQATAKLAGGLIFAMAIDRVRRARLRKAATAA